MKTELILVGGGLANSLIALRILSEAPDFPLVVIERESSLGANHTWSFHDSDLTVSQRAWIKPLIAHTWSRHELRFPRRQRVMHNGYNSVTSERLHEVVGSALGERVMLNTDAEEVTPDGVRLADGRWIEARAVIDGRGEPGGDHLEIGYQKFVGLFVRLFDEHRLAGPILMDATVEQLDGYRFVYTLPLSENELLIEDTYYSDDPGLDKSQLGFRIREYAAQQGWRIAEVIGEEKGVLPIVLGGNIAGFWDAGRPSIARTGMRGAFFHPTTGYSLPEAVKLADEITSMRRSNSRELYDLTRRRSVELWHRTSYFRLLNRMLFRAAEPNQRFRIFERFYGLSADLILRFYAGRLRWTDKVRLLIGKPPVPIHRAIGCLLRPRRRTNGANGSSTEGAT